MHLLLAVLSCGLSFVQPLQSAVVPLVQLPTAHHGNIALTHFTQRQGEGVIGSLQIGRIRQIKMKAPLLHQPPGSLSLLDPLGGSGLHPSSR